MTETMGQPRLPPTVAHEGRFGDLPYEGHLGDTLEPLYRGFRLVNRWVVVPALRTGLAPLFSTPVGGSLMILRTTGRQTGRARETPLGYVIHGGAVYCCAGFGRRTAWYRNLLANPDVEVVLPTVAFAGRATTVTDEGEWARVFPLYLKALGAVGRATVGDVSLASPDRLARLRVELPLVRIRPTGIAPGPADPGGWQWIVLQPLMALGLIWLLRAAAGWLARASKAVRTGGTTGPR